MRVFNEERGLAGTVLVIVIAWALAAVLMLTGTLIAAQQIDDRVRDITGSVSEIDKDTDSVALVEETNRIAADIRTSAAPLSGQLDEVIASAKSIDQSVTDILSTAGTINSTAKGINTTAKDIGATVDSIHGNVSGILATVNSINPGVADINGRVLVILDFVRGIRADVGKILREVGPGHSYRGGSGQSIHGHANSIDCLGVLPGVGAGTYCGQ